MGEGKMVEFVPHSSRGDIGEGSGVGKMFKLDSLPPERVEEVGDG